MEVKTLINNPIQFRIKEVTVKFTNGTQQCYFYPQVKIKVTNTTGWWRWKKTTEHEDWSGIYVSAKGAYYFNENDFSELCCHDTLRQAKVRIEQVQNFVDEQSKIKYAKVAINFTDDKLVKIHDVKSE